MKTIPNSIIQKLSKIKKEFICKTRNPKIKHGTLCKNYENGGFKNVDIIYKVVYNANGLNDCMKTTRIIESNTFAYDYAKVREKVFISF